MSPQPGQSILAHSGVITYLADAKMRLGLPGHNSAELPQSANVKEVWTLLTIRPLDKMRHNVLAVHNDSIGPAAGHTVMVDEARRT